MTPLCCFQGTQAEWQNVFYLCAGILVAGLLLFVIMGSGEIQTWAQDEPPPTKEVLLDKPWEAEKEGKKGLIYPEPSLSSKVLMDKGWIDSGRDKGKEEEIRLNGQI